MRPAQFRSQAFELEIGLAQDLGDGVRNPIPLVGGLDVLAPNTPERNDIGRFRRPTPGNLQLDPLTVSKIDGLDRFENTIVNHPSTTIAVTC